MSKMLIVEKDPDIKHLFSVILANDHTLYTTDNIWDVKNYNNGATPDVIILDLDMADKIIESGLHQLKIPTSSTVILMSSRTDLFSWVNYVTNDRECYALSKPFTIEELKHVVNKATIHHALNGIVGGLDLDKETAKTLRRAHKNLDVACR